MKSNTIVSRREFNSIPEYDSSSFDIGKFYLDDSINRVLWFRDVENKDPTRFTPLWSDYYPAAYHASHLDFVKHYKRKPNIELAFQFGPSRDLWAYHVFIIKKIECCYLITRSYFRHARFTYKAFAIIDERQVDSLYSILSKINKYPIGSGSANYYLGFFVDNRNKNSFFIDFEGVIVPPKIEKETPKEIQALYDFVDEGIDWKKTYSLTKSSK